MCWLPKTMPATVSLCSLDTSSPIVHRSSDVRTYWSPEAVRRVTEKELTGMASNGIIHLINSGATALDATGNSRGWQAGNETFWEINERGGGLPGSHQLVSGKPRLFPGGISPPIPLRSGMPVTMSTEPVKGRDRYCRLRRVTVETIRESTRCLTNGPTRPAYHMVCSWLTGDTFRDVYSVMNSWEPIMEPSATDISVRPDHAGFDLAHSVCMHNVDDEKIFRPAAWNAFGMEEGGSRLSRLRHIRPDLQIELQPHIT